MEFLKIVLDLHGSGLANIIFGINMGTSAIFGARRITLSRNSIFRLNFLILIGAFLISTSNKSLSMIFKNSILFSLEMATGIYSSPKS